MADLPPNCPSIVVEKALSSEVVLVVLLDEDGPTLSTRIETSSGGDPAIDVAANPAVNWKYLPQCSTESRCAAFFACACTTARVRLRAFR